MTMNYDVFQSRIVRCLSREHWLRERKSGIGASESASIFGVGYASQCPANVWESKVSDTAQEFDDATLRLMTRGKRMEPIIAQEFTDETGYLTHDPGEFTIFRHPEHDWIFATLDHVCEHPDLGLVPVELKNVTGRMRGEWEGDLPLKFQVQCNHQMAVTGATHCYLVGLIAGETLEVRLVERDQRFINVMIKKLGEFWQYVIDRKMPPVDDSEATAKMLARHWPIDQGGEIVLPDDAIDWDRDLAAAKADLKDAEKRKRSCENKIKAAIGDATWGIVPGGGRYSWKTQQRAEYVAAATEFRVLRRSK